MDSTPSRICHPFYQQTDSLSISQMLILPESNRIYWQYPKECVEYGQTAYKPYQEWWRERPDETRQPVISRCQIRRQTKDEDLIERITHIGSSVCGFFFLFGRKIVFLRPGRIFCPRNAEWIVRNTQSIPNASFFFLKQNLTPRPSKILFSCLTDWVK